MYIRSIYLYVYILGWFGGSCAVHGPQYKWNVLDSLSLSLSGELCSRSILALLRGLVRYVLVMRVSTPRHNPILPWITFSIQLVTKRQTPTLPNRCSKLELPYRVTKPKVICGENSENTSTSLPLTSGKTHQLTIICLENFINTPHRHNSKNKILPI